jgi:hypothetical protein
MNFKYKQIREVTITCSFQEHNKALEWCEKNKYKIVEDYYDLNKQKMRIKAQKEINLWR